MNNSSHRSFSSTASLFADSTSAEPGNISTPISSKVRSPLHLRVDVPFFIISFCLLALGLLMVYSASLQPSILLKGNPYYFFVNQIKWAVVGSIAATLAMYFDYRKLKRLIVPMIIVMLMLLIGVFVFGVERLNARRSFAGGSFQPSEFAKLAVILYLAFWLSSKKDNINDLNTGLIPMFTILGVISGLIMLQPDISAAATIILLGLILFFLASGNFRQILTVGAATLIIGGLVVMGSSSLSSTVNKRMGPYLNGLQDPAQASDHIQRSIESIVRGGMFGVGIGRGTTKFTGLPVSHTDSIFAVIVEETGLIGATLTLFLYVAFLWRGLKISLAAPDMVGRLLASGLTLWIFTEAMINIGVMVNLLPFAGNALPFISSGGSSLISCLVAVGLIMNVSRVTSLEKQKLTEGRSFHAVADLRWRNRRRSVPRSRRSTGTEER
jgi:cell division protein FtsW